MIHSMTGYAAVQRVRDGACYVLEVRSLNNKYLKLSIKVPEDLQFLESEMERIVRGRLARGSVALALRVRREAGGGAIPINAAALQRYAQELVAVRLPPDIATSMDLATLASLPGVCEVPPIDDVSRDQVLGLATELTNQALDVMVEMRRREGNTLRAELASCCNEIRERVGLVAARAPLVIDEYHERLKARVETLMKSSRLELESEGLMREVALYAERSDINEEVSRLRSHLDQFEELCEGGKPVGRTLEFLTQELLREANTIASKSGDAAIARSIVEVKGLIDRLREQVQNVE